MRGQSGQNARWLALVWLIAGIAMLTMAFISQTPNQQYVRMLAEKVLLERQNKPHDHLNPDAIEKFRPAWQSPLFLFGIGAMVLAGVQLAMAQGSRAKSS